MRLSFQSESSTYFFPAFHPMFYSFVSRASKQSSLQQNFLDDFYFILFLFKLPRTIRPMAGSYLVFFPGNNFCTIQLLFRNLYISLTVLPISTQLFPSIKFLSLLTAKIYGVSFTIVRVGKCNGEV